MALTLAQIQAMITNKEDPRQIINEIADYLQVNPAGGVASLTAGTNVTLGGTATNPVINAGSSYLVATKTLNNDEIKALPSTGVDIQVGVAGKYNKIIGGVMKITTTVPYTNISVSEKIFIQTGSGHQLSVPNQILEEADSVCDFAAEIPAMTNRAGVNNQSIKVFAENADGDYTGGHEDNTAVLTVLYVPIDI